jgi:hypothetical protein
MAVTDWIDEIVKQMGKIQCHTAKKLTVYRVASKGEIPEALAAFPCAVIYPTRLISAQYSASSGKEVWEVKGEFYIFSDNKKTNLPALMTYFAKIRDATLSSVTLGGRVDHFKFVNADSMMLAVMTYEVDGPERHGIAVTWEVKADVTGEITIG